MTKHSQKVNALFLASLVMLSIVAGVGLFSTPAAAQSISDQRNIASHADSTTQAFSFTFDLPPTSVSCTLKTSDTLGQYGVTLKSASVSGTDKLTMNVNSNGNVDLTLLSGSGTESATVTLTMSTENVQIPDKTLNHQTDCSVSSPTSSLATNQIGAQANGFQIQETGIQDTENTTIHSDDTVIENDTTLNQSIDLDLLVPDDGDSDGDTYNVTIGTEESLAHGINITDAFIEDDPTGSGELIEVVGSPVVNENETVTLTIREAAANRSDGDISQEIITIALKLDATQHDAGAFTAPDSISHVIDDEAGNTTANVTFESKLAPAANKTAVFEVSNLSAPTNATHGDKIWANASITNTGNKSGDVTVEYRFNGTVRDTTTETLAENASTNVSFTFDTSVVANETYTHGIHTGDDNATAPITIESAEQEGGNQTVRGPAQGPPPQDMAAFGSTSPLPAQQTDPGSLAGKIRVESPYTNTTNVTLVRNTSRNYTLEINNPNATNVTFFLQEQAIKASQNLSEVQLLIDGNSSNFYVNESAGPGNSPWILFEVSHFSTRTVTFTSESGTDQKEVFTEPIATGADNPPTDLNEDGLYEDINGDGVADFDDAVGLAFVDTGSLSNEQIAALDFDNDGDVDFEDAIELAFL